MIYYTYGGVTISRIDRPNRSEFYYGRIEPNDQVVDTATILAIQERGSDIMSGYLVFHRNTKVDLVVMGDHFEGVTSHSSFKIVDFANDQYFIWYEKKSGNYDSIARIDWVIRLEQEQNRENKSRVTIEYK